MSYATYRIIRNETFIEKDIWRFLSIVFDLERTNQLNLLPNKNLGFFWFLCGNEIYTDSFFDKIVLKVLPDKHFTIP
ncbi:hypothetical protein [Microcystis aeruginosa]|uniref:hypothetical protein n=1 Tax=Microcystis aeruginosa TaxID=1126 RepID=UPI003B5862AE